ISLLVDTAERIHAPARTVHLASGDTLGYDYLVYAVGSTGAAPVTVPGAAEHVHRADELEHAARLRRTLAHLPTSAPITVVGGGLTGIETAGELAARGRTVRLVCGGTLAPSFGPPARAAVQRQLAELG